MRTRVHCAVVHVPGPALMARGGPPTSPRRCERNESLGSPRSPEARGDVGLADCVDNVDIAPELGSIVATGSLFSPPAASYGQQIGWPRRGLSAQVL